ncbi:metalloprotease PmbA [Colwellia sp. MB02u-18]|uniref:metalloprotease PmbA n=1 Tax=unclassified Colwellia TaxID=196834 RepID=UPI0015F57705|nr:metalloprotease PmbA [Colwellia sp. MB3u-45]MBA6268397.1 metalloprotease PmbA [Colwellia sp. MB3u-43]MBA6319848.1 metalloprotease PmbA [Colwellia sp. MB02u-19]MBA6324608.1 metalloprotease PmbA [Colwellia sp. MB02u-18]MBA6330763.1 metalloprotease PmbA [Colwellia sp. MB02u-12]MBA6346279.1 metalloprotease PmbA [Colwellia sp. MB02u-1]
MSDSDSIQMQIEHVKKRVNDAMTMAKSLGADGAEVAMSRQQGLSVSTRLGEVENVEFTSDGGLGITVYKDGRKGSASTADLSEKALKQAIEAAVNIAKYTSVDECSGMADKDLLSMTPEDLDLYHPKALTTEQAISLAKACEDTALGYDKRITNSDGATLESFEGFKVYGNSQGQLVGYPSTRHNLSCVMIAKEGEDMQRDYAYTVSREFDAMESAATIGQQAAKETLSRLGARKLATAKVPVMFRADVANSLFGHFIAAISGGNLYRQSSFLMDAIGQQVFPEFLSISERPHLKKALASSAFDAEGVATLDREIITDGSLATYLLTSYSARKLGMKSTGHAGGIHNWQLGMNDAGQGGDFDAMLKTLGTGLLVTELMGQGVNVVTGDYSRGAAGFWVENGEIAYPVDEITIAGKLQDIFAGIVAIGNDTDMRGSIRTGSIIVNQMQVAGS